MNDTEISQIRFENSQLKEALRAAVAQLNHVEDLRRMDAGPIPATLTPEIVANANLLLR